MTFRNLLGNAVGRIILANLHYLVDDNLLDDELRDAALSRLHGELTILSPGATADQLTDAFSRALHVSDPVFQVQSTEWPDEDHRIAMVLDFTRVRAILAQILRRIQARDAAQATRIRAILRPDVRGAPIADAAAVINELSPGLSELTLSDPNRVLWGARVDEVDRILHETAADHARGPRLRARRLRDVLGLIHVNPRKRDLARHLFLFRSEHSLSKIRARPTHFSCARPSTLDGFDNRRFCQPHLQPWQSGWGMTIDIDANRCSVGLPEIVLSPLSLYHFQCEYVGKITGAAFGPDEEYLAMLAPPPLKAAAMASKLDGMVPVGVTR